MSADSKKSEAVVKQFAQGLQNLDLEFIAFLLHPEFKFVYRIDTCRGHGIRTDIRYIGHLYKTFLSMKKEGLSIKTEFCYITIDGVKYFSIILLPPHDRRIVFPMYEREGCINHVQESKMIMIIKVRHEQIYKIECYTPPEFEHRVGGIISQYNE